MKFKALSKVYVDIYRDENWFIKDKLSGPIGKN